MSRYFAIIHVAFLFIVILTANNTFAVPTVESFVLAVGGQSLAAFPNPPPFACSVSAAPAPVLNFFGAHGPGRPTEGYSECSIAGGFNLQTSPIGPLNDTRSINTTFNSGANNFTGSSSVIANYGVLKSKASGSFTGPLNSGIFEGAESFGKFREPFTITSPGIASGSDGYFRFKFFVDGSLSVAGPDPFSGAGDVEVVYQQDNGPIYILMRAQVVRASEPAFLAIPTGIGSVVIPGVYGGFTLGLGSVSGGDNIFTFTFPMKYGVPFDFTVGALTYAIPATGATVNVDFYSTTRLTGIEVFNQFGVPVGNFSVTSGSGTLYDANGLRVDDDGDGVSVAEGDCNDSSAGVHPGAVEFCDGIDNNCNGVIDDAVTGIGATCGTGLFGVCSFGTQACVSGVLVCQQEQFASAEICDGLDNNCDGNIDDGLDQDSDGSTDCNDNCALDPLKLQPGLCGCGVSDADTDGDAIPNCLDGCPNDKSKTTAGICGCGQADVDLNANGIIDCQFNDEFKFRINKATTLFQGVKLPKNLAQKKRQKVLKTSLNIVIDDLDSFVSANSVFITVFNPDLSIAVAFADIKKSLSKALKLKPATFAKDKKTANSALKKLLGIVS